MVRDCRLCILPSFLGFLDWNPVAIVVAVVCSFEHGRSCFEYAFLAQSGATMNQGFTVVVVHVEVREPTLPRASTRGAWGIGH